MSASHFLSIGSQSVATSHDGVAKINNKEVRSTKMKPSFLACFCLRPRQMSKARRHVGTALLLINTSGTISFNDSIVIRHSVCGYFH